MVNAADLSLPTDTVIRGEAGSLIELGRVAVAQDLAGPLCTWEASVTNQESSHPGNDILVVSGDTTLTLTGVEDEAGKVTTNRGSVYLASEVVVLLRMGPDEVFSGGLDLTIRYDQCGPPSTPTTTPEPQGPTTVGNTTPAIPTTVSQAPPTVSPTTTPPPAGPAILPVSGSNGLRIAMVAGIALLLAGGLLRRAALR